MIRYAIVLLATLLLSACGLAETAATGASVAASEAEAARQAQATEQDIQRKLDAAQQAAAEQRRLRTLLPATDAPGSRSLSRARAVRRRDVCAGCA